MSNDVIFYTQIGSILTFVVTLFVLYRVFINQKDATIEVLKEKNSFLETQLASYKAAAPDALVEILKKRLAYLNEEITRLAKDLEAKEALEKEVAALKSFKRAVEITDEVEAIRNEVKKTSAMIDNVEKDVNSIRAEVLKRYKTKPSG